MRISDWSSDVCSSDLHFQTSQEPFSHPGHVGCRHLLHGAIRAVYLCASLPGNRYSRECSHAINDLVDHRRRWTCWHNADWLVLDEGLISPPGGYPVADGSDSAGFDCLWWRSEERRVGKECVS